MKSEIQFNHNLYPGIVHQARGVKAFIFDALIWISEVVRPSCNAKWEVIEIGVKVVSMVTTTKLEGGILCQDCVSRPVGGSDDGASRFHVLDQSHANVTFSSNSSLQLSQAVHVRCAWQTVLVNNASGFLLIGKSNSKISRSVKLLLVYSFLLFTNKLQVYLKKM